VSLALRVLAFCLCTLLAAPARAEQTTPTPTAHPALWHVTGKHGELYLFGSLHLLPPNFAWRDAAIDDAIKRSSVFVFEVPNDEASQTRLRNLIDEKGALPKGGSLSQMLSAESRADLDAELAALHLSPAAIDDRRPWLASLILTVAQMAQEGASPESGVDVTLMKEAHDRGLELRYLETLDDQLRLIVPDDPRLELHEFEADLKDLRSEKDKFQFYLDAWASGDTAKIDKLINAGFASQPEARKALLDDRNETWLRKLESMTEEDRIFFVTVGAGHLTGKKGVPALLRAAGYHVDGPPDGPNQ
jgi:uncharacterized protein YbaP (TraB family)